MTRYYRLIRLRALMGAILLLCLASGAVGAEGPWKLTILYMNDPHAHYLPYRLKDKPSPLGGFAKAATVMEAVRSQCAQEGRDTLTLMAGDLLMGTPFSTAFRGELGVELMNRMKFDAMAVGNHEFDYGLNNLLDKLRPQMKFPLLSANIRNDRGQHVFQRKISRKGSHRAKVVIIGLTTKRTPFMTLPENVKGLVFDGPIKTARKMLRKTRDRDLVIALTHLGVFVDRKLAEACPKIDVIIGGHSHTAIPVPEKVGDTLICQAGAYSEYVGRLDLDITRGKVTHSRGELITLGPGVQEDKRLASTIQEYQTKMDAGFGKVIARTEVFLEGSRHSVRSDRETNLGKLIAYIMASNVDADIGLVNGGAIRGSLSEGDITVGGVYTVLPFRDTVVKVTLRGQDLRAVLQRSHELPQGSGGKLQAYGMTYSVKGGEVTIETVRGASFAAEKDYTVAVNNFLAAGGDGYTIFKEHGSDMRDSRMVTSDLLMDYLQRHPVISKETLEKL